MTLCIRTLLTIFTALACFAQGAEKEYRPEIIAADFTTKITNPFHPLTPGTVLKYTETGGREKVDKTAEVIRETRVVMGVRCVVVTEIGLVDGTLREKAHGWFAQHKDGSVWFFGEDAKEFLPGGRVTTAGSWEAGVNGAQPGVVMPGRLTVGFRYRQEYLRGVAEDVAEISSLRGKASAPAGEYADCVLTRDWSMLESGSTKKWFARGVGLVRSETVGEQCVLISISRK